MSKITKNLGLFEYDIETDGKRTFNIEESLNQNWDKIDLSIGNLSELTINNKENIVSAINEIETDIKNKTSLSLSNLSEAGEDRLNVSKMYETGAVSNDTKGFEELLKRAHSTFDESKFTIQGSPTITNKGIANNFTNKTFMITCDFKWIENQGTIFSSVRGGSTEYGIALIINANKLGFYSSSNGTGWNVANLKTGSTSLVSKNIYKVSVIFTGTQYICMLLNKNTGALTTEFTVDSTDKVFAGLNMINFGGNSYWQPLNGSIDLKSIAIWADGVPVFNGNKTGLFVAKPDNYEIVGSPTITEDGIASGFSGGNYLTMPNLPIIENNITMTCNVNIGVIGTIAFNYIMGWYTNESSSYLRLMYYNGKINIQWKDKDLTSGQAESNNVDSNSEHLLKFELTESNLKCYLDNVLFANVDVEINLDALTPDVFTIGRMNNVGTWILNQGSIDLNSFKVYVDGSLVYQPCLKIPYTETFEHPNVVDVAYRNRVQDLYEQTGEALFYTLDEQNQNFTLPMGDIYGMITENREILDIVYPIGRPMPEENNVLLDNEVWLEGATVNIVDYPKLFEVYGTKYGGDSITTFGLPDMRGRTLWGSPDASNGYIEAKLPNIKGSCGKFDVYEAGGEGCFNISSQTYGNTREQWGGSVAAIGFDASRSSSIYSDDATTVQPPAFKVRWKTRFE